MPLSGTICRRYAGTSYDQAVYQIWNLYLHPVAYGIRGMAEDKKQLEIETSSGMGGVDCWKRSRLHVVERKL